jgi:hypothetical protein
MRKLGHNHGVIVPRCDLFNYDGCLRENTLFLFYILNPPRNNDAPDVLRGGLTIRMTFGEAATSSSSCTCI